MYPPWKFQKHLLCLLWYYQHYDLSLSVSTALWFSQRNISSSTANSTPVFCITMQSADTNKQKIIRTKEFCCRVKRFWYSVFKHGISGEELVSSHKVNHTYQPFSTNQKNLRILQKTKLTSTSNHTAAAIDQSGRQVLMTAVTYIPGSLAWGGSAGQNLGQKRSRAVHIKPGQQKADVSGQWSNVICNCRTGQSQPQGSGQIGSNGTCNMEGQI